MRDYAAVKRQFGNAVSQTIDSPITIFDFWELQDAFAGLMIVLVCGVLFYAWLLMIVLLAVVLIACPLIRRAHKPGVFFHWPYRHLRISLPGLLNPRGRRKFSD